MRIVGLGSESKLSMPLNSPDDRTQDAEVFGDLRLGHAELVHKIVDRHFAASNGRQQLSAAGFGDGVEGIGSGRCASQSGNIYRYGSMSILGDSQILLTAFERLSSRVLFKWLVFVQVARRLLKRTRSSCSSPLDTNEVVRAAR